MKKPQTYTLSSTLQKVYIGTVSAVFALQAIDATYIGVNQHFNNPDAAGFEWYYFISVIIPLLVFVVALMLRPRIKNSLNRIFDALLISTIAMIVYSAVSGITQTIYVNNIVSGSGFELMQAYEALGVTLFFLAYVCLLLGLRYKNRVQPR